MFERIPNTVCKGFVPEWQEHREISIGPRWQLWVIATHRMDECGRRDYPDAIGGFVPADKSVLRLQILRFGNEHAGHVASTGECCAQ